MIVGERDRGITAGLVRMPLLQHKGVRFTSITFEGIESSLKFPSGHVVQLRIHPSQKEKRKYERSSIINASLQVLDINDLICVRRSRTL